MQNLIPPKCFDMFSPIAGGMLRRSRCALIFLLKTEMETVETRDTLTNQTAEMFLYSQVGVPVVSVIFGATRHQNYTDKVVVAIKTCKL